MTTSRSSLVVDVRAGGALELSNGVTIELLQKSGQFARLRVIAPRSVGIERRDQDPRDCVPSMAI